MSSFFGREHPPIGEQYRETTLGRTLMASLDELIRDGKITPKLATKILIHFDVGINAQLARCACRVTFRAMEIVSYKEFQKVYTIILKSFEVCGRGRVMPMHVGNIKRVMIIAHPSTSQMKKGVAQIDEVVDEIPDKQTKKKN